MNSLIHSHERAPRTRVRACVVALCASFSFMQSTEVLAQTPEKGAIAQENKRVRELFRKGSKALEARKYLEAQKVLEEAWTLRQTYDVAAALAQAESELGHYVKAATYLDFCLKNIAPAESEQTLQQLQAAFEDVKTHIAIVRVSVNRSGADVSIGDRSVGTSPLPSDLFLEPGTLSVRARHGGLEATDTLVTEAGGQYALDLSFAEPTQPAAKLEPVPPPVVAPPPAVVEDRGSHEQKPPNLVPVVVGGTVFLLGVGTGLGLHFAATADSEDADRIRERTGPDGCARGTAESSDCASLRSLADSQDRNRNLSTASFVVAGVALVGTATYWFWPRGRSEDRARAPAGTLLRPRMSAVAVPGFATITLSGQF